MASFNKICKHNPHFFKVVRPHALEQQKLEIPKKFVKHYGGTALSKDQTCLKVGDGREWDVGLKKSNGRVWFDRGWQKFVKFYAVGLDYFLVFEYDKTFSNFNVVIFDPTATEIEYPTKHICVDEDHEEISVKMETSLDDVSYSQVGEVSFGAKRRMNSKYKEMKNPTPSATPSSTTVYKQRGRTRSTEEATAFQSRIMNPSSMSKISPSCIDRRRLCVSQRFTEMHLENTIETKLELSDGREWNIRCCVNTQRRRAEFGDGLKKFVRDNNLKVGDACVFEMINKNSKKISFKAYIFRAS